MRPAPSARTVSPRCGPRGRAAARPRPDADDLRRQRRHRPHRGAAGEANRRARCWRSPRAPTASRSCNGWAPTPPSTAGTTTRPRRRVCSRPDGLDAALVLAGGERLAAALREVKTGRPRRVPERRRTGTARARRDRIARVRRHARAGCVQPAEPPDRIGSVPCRAGPRVPAGRCRDRAPRDREAPPGQAGVSRTWRRRARTRLNSRGKRRCRRAARKKPHGARQITARRRRSGSIESAPEVGMGGDRRRNQHAWKRRRRGRAG